MVTSGYSCLEMKWNEMHSSDFCGFRITERMAGQLDKNHSEALNPLKTTCRGFKAHAAPSKLQRTLNNPIVLWSSYPKTDFRTEFEKAEAEEATRCVCVCEWESSINWRHSPSGIRYLSYKPLVMQQPESVVQ